MRRRARGVPGRRRAALARQRPGMHGPTLRRVCQTIGHLVAIRYGAVLEEPRIWWTCPRLGDPSPPPAGRAVVSHDRGAFLSVRHRRAPRALTAPTSQQGPQSRPPVVRPRRGGVHYPPGARTRAAPAQRSPPPRAQAPTRWWLGAAAQPGGAKSARLPASCRGSSPPPAGPGSSFTRAASSAWRAGSPRRSGRWRGRRTVSGKADRPRPATPSSTRGSAGTARSPGPAAADQPRSPRPPAPAPRARRGLAVTAPPRPPSRRRHRPPAPRPGRRGHQRV